MIDIKLITIIYLVISGTACSSIRTTIIDFMHFKHFNLEFDYFII